GRRRAPHAADLDLAAFILRDFFIPMLRDIARRAAMLWALVFSAGAGAQNGDSSAAVTAASVGEGFPASGEVAYSDVDTGAGTGIGGGGQGLGGTLDLPAVTVRRKRPAAEYRGMEGGLRFSSAQAAHAISSLGDPLRFVQTLPG